MRNLSRSSSQAALLSEPVSESCQNQLNICWGGIVPHDAHPPCLANSTTQAACNLDAVLGHGIGIDCCPVHSLWYLHTLHSKCSTPEAAWRHINCEGCFMLGNRVPACCLACHAADAYLEEEAMASTWKCGRPLHPFQAWANVHMEAWPSHKAIHCS